MSELTVRIYGDPCLKKVSDPIDDVDGEVRALIRDMGETLYANRGVGLAAPQVGVNRRLFVMDVDWVGEENGEQPERRLQVFVNPEIVWESDEDSSANEGCLSLPGIDGDVFRPVSVTMRYRDETGESHERKLEHLEARCVQHELDHLDGIVFVDRMPFLKRQALAGRLRAVRKKNHVPAK